MIKILLLTTWFYTPYLQPPDSIGKETINGKIYVLYKVGEKETLYGISKKYGTTVDAILQQNPTADAGLEQGQILKIPYVRSSKKIYTNTKHIVAEKETLFSISKMYGLTVDELKQLNKLTENDLNVGQELIVTKPTAAPPPSTKQPSTQSIKGIHTVATKETLFAIAKQYGIQVDQLKQWNNLTGNELKTGQILYVVPPVNTSTPVVQPSTTSEIATKNNPLPPTNTIVNIPKSYTDGKEVRETGLAELIEGTQGNRKYLALHRTAPVGTILKLKNQMNDREIFVRVVGKLPETVDNDKLIIKISKSAYDRLGAIDPRFMIEVTWYK